MAYKDIEKHLATSRAWWARNPDKRKLYRERYAAKQKALRPPKAPKRFKFKGRESDYGREWRQRNPHRIAERKWQERQNREARYAAIAGRPKPDICDICAEKIGNIVYDHCHKKGHFRGFLCDRCNMVLGIVEDNPRLLTAMAAYLQRTRENTSRQLALPGI